MSLPAWKLRKLGIEARIGYEEGLAKTTSRPERR